MNIKLSLLIASLLVVISLPALACSGTQEFPKVTEQLNNPAFAKQSNVSAAELKMLKQELAEGNALHEEAHKANNKKMMGKSLIVLKNVKDKMK